MSYRITESCNGCAACVKWCPVSAISGEKKALHAIDRDLCIECGACGRICPQGSVQDAFGITSVMQKKSQWEKPQFDIKECMVCGICIDACPAGCLGHITLSDGSKQETVGLVDEKICIGCSFCRRECPVDAITMIGSSVAS